MAIELEDAQRRFNRYLERSVETMARRKVEREAQQAALSTSIAADISEPRWA